MGIQNPLGQFYFGREYSLEDGRILEDRRVDYDAKDLCTHAVCVGMTGSGKTGLCLSLLEEAALDGIPAICIDPKGDLGNLMLTFPDLRTEDFRPWIDPGDAARKGRTVDEAAESTADAWRRGLAEWGYGSEYVRAFRESVDVSIYTPASTAGLPLTVLKSFKAPPPEMVDDREAMRDRINSAVSGLLALMQIDADPISSREHILLATILGQAWSEGRDIDMGTLIREIQAPPFEKVGFLDLEAFYPANDRFKLSMQLNNLLASPGFAAWMEGEPLDIQKLMYRNGKPQISILSIAHLSDEERMFFVTIVLNELVTWMRGQSGTSSLRALFYMDEVFGFFPPTANPPSKQPMLTLMKQARAFGLGCVLATQNPVDLDYKGLSNAGTWFLGRLQTERDKLRVLDGLEGASAQAGAGFDRARMDQTLAALGSRVFLMNNVHEDEPVVFHTRWVMSYLRGPLTRNQIRTLMDDQRAARAATAPAARSIAPSATPQQVRPVLRPEIEQRERFLPAHRAGDIIYRPALFGTARAHYIQSRSSSGIDEWRDIALLQPIGDTLAADIWADADMLESLPSFARGPAEKARFADLAPELTQPRKYSAFQSRLKEHVYRHYTMQIWKCRRLKARSEPGETEEGFRVRLKHRAREERDLRVEKLRRRYASRIGTAEERIRKAEQRVEREKHQRSSQRLSSVISIGSNLLSALMGRKLASSTNVRRVGSAARSVARGSKESADVAHAEETVAEYERRLIEMNEQLEDEIRETEAELDIHNLELEQDELRPRKSDLSVSDVLLVWAPWTVDQHGIAEPAF